MEAMSARDSMDRMATLGRVSDRFEGDYVILHPVPVRPPTAPPTQMNLGRRVRNAHPRPGAYVRLALA